MSSPKPQASCLSASSSCVQVIDSGEPLAPTAPSRVQNIDSSEPLVPATSPVATGPSGMAGLSNAAHMADLVMPPSASPPPVSETGSSGRRLHYYVEEIRSMWNTRKIYNNLGTHEQCVQFAEERGLILRQKICNHHRRPMSLISHGQLGMFRCYKSNCRSRSVSRASGTWFENVNLPLTTVFELMYFFCNGASYEIVQKETCKEDSETVLSMKTIADWYSYCREAVIVYELEQQDERPKIGGVGKVVQIDESKFGKRKYHRGRHIEGHWVLGMIEDGSDDLRVEVCPDNERSADVLVPLIKKHVREGSTIHTDFWRAYMCLPEHGYIHRMVNHSDPEHRFVAPDGTHTQRIESHWRVLKRLFHKDQFKGNFTDWLIELSWRRRIRIQHLDPFEELMKAVLHVYRV